MKTLKFIIVSTLMLFLTIGNSAFSTFKQFYFHPFFHLYYIDTSLKTYFRQFNALKYNPKRNSLDTFQLILKNTNSLKYITINDYVSNVFFINTFYHFSSSPFGISYVHSDKEKSQSICNHKGELRLINFDNVPAFNRPKLDSAFYTHHHFFFDNKFRIIDIDTTIYYRSSVLFQSEVNKQRYYFIAYEADSLSKHIIRIKTFEDKSFINSPQKVSDVSMEIPPPFNVLLGTHKDLRIIRKKNGKDWWIITLCRALLLDSNRKVWNEYDLPLRYSKTIYIRVFSFEDNQDGSFKLNTTPTFVDSLIVDPNERGVLISAISPKGNLVALSTYNFDSLRIFLLSFDKSNGTFKSLTNDNILTNSYISLKNKSIPNFTIFQFSKFKTWFSPIYKNFTFSIDGKKLFLDKFVLDVSSLSLDSIKKSFSQFLPNSLTYLEFYSRFGITDINKAGDDFIPNSIGRNGSIFDYWYFPYFNSKFYLYTLSFLDTLSQPIAEFRKEQNPKFRVPAYFDYLLRSYEIKYISDSAKYVFHFLKADTLHFNHLISMHKFGRKPDFLNEDTAVLHSDHIFFNPNLVYYEYLYPFTTLPFQVLGDGSICESTDLTFRAIPEDSTIPYSFRWVGPNGFEANGESILIPNAKPFHSGWYYCYATIGDTTYVDSLEVEVVATPRIHFKRGLPVNVCNADSVELEIDFPRASWCDYFVLWSTGDTTNKVTLRKEGSYWVKVWNDLGCTDSVGFEVRFNKPLEAKIIASRDWVCIAGDSLELIVEGEGSRYEWNDGTKGKRRWAYAPGRYTVVVTNDYGCTDTASIEIRKEEVDLRMDEVVDLGEVYVGSRKEKVLEIRNPGRNRARISRAEFVGNGFMVDTKELDGKYIENGEANRIWIKFEPKELGELRGEIVVGVDSPCVAEYKIRLLGIGKGKVVVWSPWDTLAMIGEKNYCIPVYGKLVEGVDGVIHRWEGRMLISTKLLFTNEGRIEGERRVYEAKGENILNMGEERKLIQLCGQLMMSGKAYELVELDSFNFGEYLDVEERNGRIRLFGICMPELSRVEGFLPSEIKEIAIDEKEIRVIVGGGEVGRKHMIRIYNILGVEASRVEWVKEGKEEEIRIERASLGDGIYLIELSDGSERKIYKIIMY